MTLINEQESKIELDLRRGIADVVFVNLLANRRLLGARRKTGGCCQWPKVLMLMNSGQQAGDSKASRRTNSLQVASFQQLPNNNYANSEETKKTRGK